MNDVQKNINRNNESNVSSLLLKLSLVLLIQLSLFIYLRPPSYFFYYLIFFSVTSIFIVFSHHYLKNKRGILIGTFLFGCFLGLPLLVAPFGYVLGISVLLFSFGMTLFLFLSEKIENILVLSNISQNYGKILKLTLLILIFSVYSILMYKASIEFKNYSNINNKNLYVYAQSSFAEILKKDISPKERLIEIYKINDEVVEECSILEGEDKRRCYNIAGLLSQAIETVGQDNKYGERDPSIPSLICEDSRYIFEYNSGTKRVSCYSSFGITEEDCVKIDAYTSRKYCLTNLKCPKASNPSEIKGLEEVVPGCFCWASHRAENGECISKYPQ